MTELYHLTTQENAGKILKQGLIPMIGENAKRVDEDRDPAVCLTEKPSLPYWRILLNCDSLLKIDPAGIDTDKLHRIGYTDYAELLYPDTVKPEYITQIPCPAINKTIMQNLAIEFFEAIQIACTQAATVHAYAGDPPEGYDKLVEAYHTRLVCITGCIQNINFRVISQREYRKMLKNLAEDGEFTMTDEYRPSPRNPNPDRLWEMLGKYPMSPEKQLEQRLYRAIKHAWTRKTLHTATGGWSIE